MTFFLRFETDLIYFLLTMQFYQDQVTLKVHQVFLYVWYHYVF